MANLATNFQDLVAKVKNLGALAPVLGAISRPGISVHEIYPKYTTNVSFSKHNLWLRLGKKPSLYYYYTIIMIMIIIVIIIIILLLLKLFYRLLPLI